MNILAFDPIRAMSHDFLRVSQYFTIPPKLYKRSEAVARLVRRRESRVKQEKGNIGVKNYINLKLQEEELSMENYYS